MADDGNWVTVAKVAALNPGDVLGVTLGEREIALYNLDGDIYATDNVCTHAFAQLSQGWLDGDIIECPLHGGRFEVKTEKARGRRSTTTSRPIRCAWPARTSRSACPRAGSGGDPARSKPKIYPIPLGLTGRNSRRTEGVRPSLARL